MSRFTNGEVQYSQETDGAPRMISTSLYPSAQVAKNSIHLLGQYTTQVYTMSNIKALCPLLKTLFASFILIHKKTDVTSAMFCKAFVFAPY